MDRGGMPACGARGAAEANETAAIPAARAIRDSMECSGVVGFSKLLRAEIDDRAREATQRLAYHVIRSCQVRYPEAGSGITLSRQAKDLTPATNY